MLKHFCDRCGKQLEGIFVKADVRFRAGLPRVDVGIEFCKECVDLAFGQGFTERLEAQQAEKQKEMKRRREERLAKKLGDVSPSVPPEPACGLEESQ